MQRRHFIRALASTATFIAAAPVLAADPPSDEDAPLVAAPKIIDALSDKRIVLDQPGAGQPARGAAQRLPRDPSIALRVAFLFGSAELLPHGKRQLDQLAMALSDTALADAAFELAGHTDAVGDAQANLRLSIERAQSVKAYLVESHGLSTDRLQTIGFGASRLADPVHPTAALNRRVEVRRLRRAAGELARPATGGRLVPTP